MRGVSVKIACEGASLIEIDDMVEFQGELKSLSEKNYNRLKTEILETGLGFPFRCWRHEAKIYIIGGHQTKRTLVQMRDKEGFTVPRVPVSWVQAKDYKEAKRRVLQDIAQYGTIEKQGLYEFLSEAEIKIEELSERYELPEIDMESFKLEFLDLEIPYTSLTQEEINKRESKEDEVPEVTEDPRTRIGDLYILGDHRLMCGDSTSIDDVGKLTDGEKADMVFTDPPYNQETDGGPEGPIGSAFAKQSREIEHLCDFDPSLFLNVLPKVFNKNRLNAYLFCNKDLVVDYLKWARDNKFAYNILIWKKPSAIPIGGSYRPDVEYLLVFRKTGIFNGALDNVSYSKVLEHKREINKVHPTMKPVEMIENQLKIASNFNSPVLDFFGGSGSTLIACEKTNRRCFMMELDPHYCDVIVSRYLKYVGQTRVIKNGVEVDWELSNKEESVRSL